MAWISVSANIFHVRRMATGQTEDLYNAAKVSRPRPAHVKGRARRPFRLTASRRREEVTYGIRAKDRAIAAIAVARDDGSGLKYILTDHLGSVVATTDASGTLKSQQRYLPFGEVRDSIGNSPRISETDFGYTGQRNVADMGLLDYRARFYDPTIGRFIQPDSIVPGYANPQALNRFSYVLGNPIRLTDPTGHWECEDAYTCEHSDTIESQVLAEQREQNQEPKEPVASRHHTGDEEGTGTPVLGAGFYSRPPIPRTPSGFAAYMLRRVAFGGEIFTLPWGTANPFFDVSAEATGGGWIGNSDLLITPLEQGLANPDVWAKSDEAGITTGVQEYGRLSQRLNEGLGFGGGDLRLSAEFESEYDAGVGGVYTATRAELSIHGKPAALALVTAVVIINEPWLAIPAFAVCRQAGAC